MNFPCLNAPVPAKIVPPVNDPMEFELGAIRIKPTFRDGNLTSLGQVECQGVPLRNTQTRFLPWLDLYDGGIFDRFRWEGSEQRGETLILRTRAICNNDYPFRERRDASGDLCFRTTNWDAPALEEKFAICLEPCSTEIGGLALSGFRYWFEWDSTETPLHRLLDRQTWELGGSVEGNTLLCRNWLTPPRVRLSQAAAYSTVGLDKWASLLPGNLWARWSLLPSFDFQYGPDGILLGWFDRVSLIRSVLESNPEEDVLRVMDLHLFEQSLKVQTNPKTILFSPEEIDDVDAINLWTRVQDAESQKARQQFNLPEEAPPAIVVSKTAWSGVHFDTTYESMVEIAGEFGADYVFIDSVFEHQEAYRQALETAIPPERRDDPILKKFAHHNMCVTLDFEVAQAWGGEAGLRALCARAAQRGVKVLSWMASHLSPNSSLKNDRTLGGDNLFAMKESGRHPDTGYASSCWTVNLHSPIGAKLREQLTSVCQRTGLAGYLWDSFSNLGWWQLDYGTGTMRPQFEQTMELYAALESEGLYLMPEALVQFSSHSCCGMHGGEIYSGELAPLAYNSNIPLFHSEFTGEESPECHILKGSLDWQPLFEAISHRRIPNLAFDYLPREEWNPERHQQIREWLRVYKTCRTAMQRRTVLKDHLGVLWENDGPEAVFFAYQDQPADGPARDAATGEATHLLRAGRVYWIIPPPRILKHHVVH